MANNNQLHATKLQDKAWNLSSDDNMKKRALELLVCDEKTLEEREISGLNAKYYRNTVRGGGAIIISVTGEMLFMDPFLVGYNEHTKRFASGERSSFE